MKLSLMDEQEVRTFAQENEVLIKSVISHDAEAVHGEENFFGDPFSVAMFLSFVKSLAEVLAGVVAVTKVLTSVEELFKWVESRLSGDSELPVNEPTLTERILILVFEAYVNRKLGVKEETLSLLLNEAHPDITEALRLLEAHGVVRKTYNGAWMYVRPL